MVKIKEGALSEKKSERQRDISAQNFDVHRVSSAHIPRILVVFLCYSDWVRKQGVTQSGIRELCIAMLKQPCLFQLVYIYGVEEIQFIR